MRRSSLIAIVAFALATGLPCIADAQTSARKKTKNPSRGTTVQRWPKWDSVPASTVRLQRGKLLIGLADGGVGIYNEESGAAMNVVRGANLGASGEVVWEGNHAWWVNTRTGKLHFVTVSSRSLGEVDLSASGMTEPARRVSLWQGKVLVQGFSQIRVVDPLSKRVERPEDYFPSEIARQLQQGTVMSTWYSRSNGTGEGQLVLIRRYSRRGTEQPGKRENASITAWYSTGKNYRWLSTYIRPIVEFIDAPGPQVDYVVGRKRVQESFAYCDTGNLQVNEHGVIALDRETLLAVPLRTSQWVPNEIIVRARPEYAQSISSSSNNAWWTDGKRLYCASIENGLTDVYVPATNSAAVTDLAADDEGVWVVRGQRLSRVRASFEGANGFSGFIRYAAVDPKTDLSEGEVALRTIATAPAAFSAWDLVNRSLGAAGYSGARLSTVGDVRRVGRRIRGELMIGDVVTQGAEPAVFIGNGTLAKVRGGKTLAEPLAWSATTEVYRMLDNRKISAFRPGAVGPLDVDPIARVSIPGRMSQRVPFFGLGKPNPALGHDMFVTLNIGGKYDRPWLPMHEQMLDEGRSWFGTPYLYGGTTRDGIDCSAFVQAVFRSVGVRIPRTSFEMGQTSMGIVVTDDLRFGDVLVYSGHVALYIGNGKTMETVSRKGPWTSNIWRRDRAIVRRFITQ